MNHNANHEGHGKMMWLMMLMCLIPGLFVLLSGSKINKWYIVLFLAVCVGGHFLVMKFWGHSKNEENEKKDDTGDHTCH